MIFNYKIKNSQNGQSLIELLTGVAVVSIFLLGAVLVIVSILRIGRTNLDNQTAQDISAEILDNVRAISTSNWQNIYGLGKGSSSKYYVTSTINGLTIASGTELLTIDNIAYTRYFFVENICRSDSGSGGVGDILDASISSTCVSGTEDPSTQRVTAKVNWLSSGDNESIGDKTLAEIMTHFNNQSSEQNLWTGGPVGESISSNATTTFASSSNIDYSSSTGAIKLLNP